MQLSSKPLIYFGIVTTIARPGCQSLPKSARDDQVISSSQSIPQANTATPDATAASDLNRLLDSAVSHIPCDNLLMFDLERNGGDMALRVNLNGLFPIASGPSLSLAYRLADGKAQQMFLSTRDPRANIDTDSRYFDRQQGDWVTRVQSTRSSRAFAIDQQQITTLAEAKQLVAVIELEEGQLTRQCSTQFTLDRQAQVFGVKNSQLAQSFNQGLALFLQHFAASAP